MWAQVLPRAERALQHSTGAAHPIAHAERAPSPPATPTTHQAYDCAALLLIGAAGAVNFGPERAEQVLPRYMSRINFCALQKLKEALGLSSTADIAAAAAAAVAASRGDGGGAGSEPGARAWPRGAASGFRGRGAASAPACGAPAGSSGDEGWGVARGSPGGGLERTGSGSSLLGATASAPLPSVAASRGNSFPSGVIAGSGGSGSFTSPWPSPFGGHVPCGLPATAAALLGSSSSVPAACTAPMSPASASAGGGDGNSSSCNITSSSFTFGSCTAAAVAPQHWPRHAGAHAAGRAAASAPLPSVAPWGLGGMVQSGGLDGGQHRWGRDGPCLLYTSRRG